MATANHRAEDIARELGLEFQSETTKDGKWIRFRFAFPADDRGPEYVEAVKRVTAWRKRLQPWMFVGAPDTVAVELSWWNRFRVAGYNKKNRKALAKFFSDEATARRWAMSQPTPQQALSVLREKAPGSKDPETVKLRKALEEAALLVERDAAKRAAEVPDNVVPLKAASA